MGKRKLPNCVFNPIISDLVRFSPNGAFIWHTVVNPVSHSSKKFNLYYSSKHTTNKQFSFRESQFVLQTKKQDFINLNKAGSAFGQYIDWQVDEIQGKKLFSLMQTGNWSQFEFAAPIMDGHAN